MQVTILILQLIILIVIVLLAIRPNMKGARELNLAAWNLKGLLKGVNRETLDKLAQISSKLTRLDLSGTLLAVSLTAIGSGWSCRQPHHRLDWKGAGARILECGLER